LDTNFWGFFMTKYNEQFRLQVVQHYLHGPDGYRATGAHFGLDDKMVKRWVDWFQAHGIEGLKKKYAVYSAHFKLSVLQHIWDNELSYAQAGALFNIRNPGILSVWERAYRDGGIDALEPRPRGKPKKMAAPTTKPEPTGDDEKRTREDLLVELQHLRMENAYLKKLRALVQAQQKATPPKKRK
jgi:transposase